MAISCMWAWMIPHFYIEFTEYRLALEKVSLAWNSGCGERERENANDSNPYNKNSYNSSSILSPREKANRATVEGVFWAIGIIGVVYIGSALVIGALTAEPDPSVLTKPDAIAVGVGRMLSSCLLAYFSVEFPRWLGITYASQKRVECYKQVLLEPSAKSNKELSFRVCWSFLGHFFILYPFLLTYFCNESFAHVALSTGVGIAFGFAVVYFLWLGHTKLNYRTRKKMAIVLSLVIALSSAAAFSAGCWYIKEVWQGNDLYSGDYATATYFVWLALCLFAHGVYYRLTVRKLAEAKALRARTVATTATSSPTTTASTNNIPCEHTVVGDDSEAASSTMRREEEDDFESSMKGEWRYNSQVFQPPKSVHCVATGWSNPFASLQAMMKIGRRPQQQRQQEQEHQESDDSNDDQDNNSQKASHATISNDVGDENLLPEVNLIGINEEKKVDHVALNRQTATISPKATKKCVRMNIGEAFTTDDTIDRIECCAKMDHHSALAPARSDIETQDKRHLGSTDKLASPTTDHINIIVASISNVGDDSFSVESIEEREIPTLWAMVKDNSCCRRRKHYQAPRRRGWSRFVTIFKWTLWTLACSWHLSFVVLSIGASYQQNKVRGALFGAYEKLYPGNYTTGAMCAWDEASPNADIRTFDSFQDVMDMGYTIIHCGECGYCSNWNDLSLQWTTREHLAKKAKDCVTKSILGSRDEVQQCNEDSIGFTEECALCWTVDEYCARDNCMFIFLQSVFTNQVNNFDVGPDDITSATCDEALCGPGFVPCSGATRRRMNIISDIPRPISQQCDVAVEDWSMVFDHP